MAVGNPTVGSLICFFGRERTMARTLKEYTDVVVKLEDWDTKMNFTQIFGRTAPVNVEFGSGKGPFRCTKRRRIARWIF